MSRYNCSVTLWALKWTWVMMEMDKNYRSTIGAGRGVGCSLSLMLFHMLYLGTWMCCATDLLRKDHSLSLSCVRGYWWGPYLAVHFVHGSPASPEEQPKTSSLVSPAGWWLGNSPGVSVWRVSLFSESGTRQLRLDYFSAWQRTFVSPVTTACSLGSETVCFTP